MKNATIKIFLFLMIGMGSLINSISAQDETFKVVDEMPRFPGCEMLKANAEVINKCAQEKMLQFIYKNVVYPAEAREQGVEGMAVVQFVIGKKGLVQDIKLVRDPGAGTGAAAVAVVEAMNKMPERWIPGKQRGEYVKVLYTLPIKFKLDQESKNKVIKKGNKGASTNNRVQKNDQYAKVSPFKKKTTQINPKQMENPNTEVPPPPPPAPPRDQEEIFKVVEDMPRFKACEKLDVSKQEKQNCAKEKMLEYIYTNLEYPEDARKNMASGTAVVQFVIQKDGKVADATVVRDPGYGMGQAALNVVNSMKAWVPGKQRGRAVQVLYTLPVKFKLNEDGTVNRAEFNAKKKPMVQKKKSTSKNRNTQVNPRQMEDPSSEVPPPPPPPAPPVETSERFKIVEQMPRFPGCEDMDGDQRFKTKCAEEKMHAYIAQNIVYPDALKNQTNKGKTIIQFVVKEDGSIVEAKIVRDAGKGMGEAALDVINGMPKWIPGRQRGKAVSVIYNVPFNFK